MVTACQLEWALRTFFTGKLSCSLKSERLKNLRRSYESNLCQFVIYSNHLRFAYLKNTLTRTHFQPQNCVLPAYTQPPSCTPTLKISMAHCKKWHQLINIHEPFTWAPLCVLQGLIQTETRLFCSSADCVTPLFVGETHQLVFQGNVSPHWEPNLPPLSPSSSCAPSVLRAGSSIS